MCSSLSSHHFLIAMATFWGPRNYTAHPVKLLPSTPVRLSKLGQSRPRVATFKPSQAAQPPGRNVEQVDTLQELRDAIPQLSPAPRIPNTGESGQQLEREPSKPGNGADTPASTQPVHSTGDKLGEKASVRRKQEKGGKPRPGDDKSVSLRPNPFPVKSSPSRSIWRKRKTDDVEKIVSKAVIDFIAKQSDEQALQVLTRTAQTFGNQPPLWDQASSLPPPQIE